jgi:hypothetical protein
MGLCHTLEDPNLTLFMGIYFCRTAQVLGRLSETEGIIQEGLQIAREAGNRWGIAGGLERLAAISLAAGKTAEARQMLEESVGLHREVGDSWGLAWALNALSRLALGEEELLAAEEFALEAVNISAEAGLIINALEALSTLAAVCSRQGKTGPALKMTAFILRHPASTRETVQYAEKIRAGLPVDLAPAQNEALLSQTQEISIAGLVNELLFTSHSQEIQITPHENRPRPRVARSCAANSGRGF